MKIEPTPAKAVADKKKVKIGDYSPTFRIDPTPPKAVADNKKVKMGDYSPTFRIDSTPLRGPSFNDHFSGVAAGYATFRPT